jgi:stearoyl-CoA desaturase (Delta-9 desaturase)
MFLSSQEAGCVRYWKQSLESKMKFVRSIYKWLDNNAEPGLVFGPRDRKVDYIRLIPFWGMHLACLGVIWTGVSGVAAAAAVALYLVRMFAITGWYHRYFSHRTFKTGRGMQFLFALIGNASAQRGALHWAAHHRNHHRFSDKPEDPHSPRQHGFWISHTLWFSTRENSSAKTRHLKDFCQYPELIFLDRFDFVAPLGLALLCYGLGALLGLAAPSLHTSGPQMLVWAFFISTVVLYHGTFSINSLGHVLGRTRFATGDDSRNSAFLALITLGEGWHNNHHHYPNSVRQGFRWWEFDVSFYGLWAMSKLGLVWDLKPVPARMLRPEAAAGPAFPAPAPRSRVSQAGPRRVLPDPRVGVLRRTLHPLPE